MTSNRQQLATGLKAILGGATAAARPAAPPAAQPTETFVAPSLDHAAEDPAAGEVELETVATSAEPAVAPLPAVRPSKPRRKVEAVVMVPSSDKRVGTLERPYVRQRDNQPTRKVGVVLPVDLAERLQIHCVKTRSRTNSFIEQAIAMALDEAGA